jgi:hypothetical protein
MRISIYQDKRYGKGERWSSEGCDLPSAVLFFSEMRVTALVLKIINALLQTGKMYHMKSDTQMNN